VESATIDLGIGRVVLGHIEGLEFWIEGGERLLSHPTI